MNIEEAWKSYQDAEWEESDRRIRALIADRLKDEIGIVLSESDVFKLALSEMSC